MHKPIRIMPHHFVDIVRAHFPTGQAPPPSELGHDVHRVVARLLDDRGAVLEIAIGSDDICIPCAHFVDGRCDTMIDTSFRKGAPPSMHDYNLLIDHRWCRRLSLSEGDRLTARQFCERLQDDGGNMASIYPETPAATTAQWVERIRAGIAAYLA
jgi:hypothetical protein